MLCNNSWIELSWDGKPARIAKENLTANILKRAKTLMDFDSACDTVAKEIGDTYNNLYLALSGGSDSEYVATCLVRNKIPFTPLLIDYNQTKNIHQYELWYAHQWCKKHSITPLVVSLNDYAVSQHETLTHLKIKPRLFPGSVAAGFLQNLMNQLNGTLITGTQLEYYPDAEQMTYLEPQLGNYQGFVIEESDFYLETLEANRHPWAFFYWSPEVMASFVHSWNINLTMQENKSAIYKTSPRPKFFYPRGFDDYWTKNQITVRTALIEKWGTRDCALLGTKEHLLLQLLG